MEDRSAVRMDKVTKRFGSVVANDKVSMNINYGEILCILGENGSGKTTLMNMITGVPIPQQLQPQPNMAPNPMGMGVVDHRPQQNPDTSN
jgi:ABC-type uncharacterized transport system ATPase subunit